MNLKCSINGKEYNISQGATFSEEYNETLDSGVIIIPHSERLKDLNQYDDVFIYDSDSEFNGIPPRKYSIVKEQEEADILLDIKRAKENGVEKEFTQDGVVYYEYVIGTNSQVRAILENAFVKRDETFDSPYGTQNHVLELPKTFVNLIFNYVYNRDLIHETRQIITTFEITKDDQNHVILKSINDEEDLTTIVLSYQTSMSSEDKLKDFSYSTFVIPKYRRIDLLDFQLNSIENDYFSLKYMNEETFEVYDNDVKKPKFYKHLLIDKINSEILNLSNSIYKYKIHLFSETKKLEAIILPNVSITQPLNSSKKISIYEYAKNFVERYSPVIKICTDEEKHYWRYFSKYTIDPSLKDVFSDVYAPDFSLNAPSLRELLNRLFIVKDMIPYVQDNVIKALDITKRNGIFNKKGLFSITSSKDSQTYCENLRRPYSNALSQDKTARMVEYLGFRNSDTALLTLDNMRIETRFPIYKINKIYMCYYKKATVVPQVPASLNDYSFKPGYEYKENNVIYDDGKYYKCLESYISTDSFENDKANGKWEEISSYKIFLCKQDITPLVKLNSERNILSKDWDNFNDETIFTSIEDMSQYRLCTVGYDIGSKSIVGWGEKYQYPKFIWDVEATYIENILRIVDNLTPYGVEGYTKILKEANLGENILLTLDYANYRNNLVNPFDKDIVNLTNQSLFYKGLFFIIDYNAFYNGTIVHSKDILKDDITISDNSSSSLTLLEADGLYQKEKVNRYGNEEFQFHSRYNDLFDENGVENVQALGSVYEDDYINDVVIYHKEYSVWHNGVDCNYYGVADYVLKNYFTTVFAKYRTYNLMSYGESVLRAENEKMFIMMSKDKSFYEENFLKFGFENFDEGIIFSLLSFAQKSLNEDYVKIAKDKVINYGYFSFEGYTYDEKGNRSEEKTENFFANDINVFVSGNSICFNMQMFDNVSSGVFIREREPEYTAIWENVKDDFTGSVQHWHLMVDDIETGFLKRIGVYFGNVNQKEIFYDGVYDGSEEKKIQTEVYDKIFQLPKINRENISNIKYKIGREFYAYKDNKEQLDFTFQIEPFSLDENIMFSQYLMKLSNINNFFHKRNEDIFFNEFANEFETSTDSSMLIEEAWLTNPIYQYPRVSGEPGETILRQDIPTIIFSIKNENWEKIKQHFNENPNIPIECSLTAYFQVSQKPSDTSDVYLLPDEVSFQSYIALIENIKSISDNSITVSIRHGSTFRKQFLWFHGKNINSVVEDTATFNMITSFGIGEEFSFDLSTDRKWFTNIEFYEEEYYLKTLLIAKNNVPVKYFYNNKSLEDPRPNVSCDKYLNLRVPEQRVLNSTTAQRVDFNIQLGSEPKELKRNMYVVLSKESLKKSVLYDEYSVEDMRKNSMYFVDGLNQYGFNVLDETENILDVTKVFSIDNYGENEMPIIQVKLEDINLNKIDFLKKNLKSIQYWFLDNDILHFVFGVNISEEDFENNLIQKENGKYDFILRIYISLLGTKDERVYDINMKHIGNIKNYAENSNKDIYGENQLYDIKKDERKVR